MVSISSHKSSSIQHDLCLVHDGPFRVQEIIKQAIAIFKDGDDLHDAYVHSVCGESTVVSLKEKSQSEISRERFPSQINIQSCFTMLPHNLKHLWHCSAATS